MRQILQRSVQAVFLALFAVLVATGKAQLWMGLFVLAILAALLFGRIYCGWICPIRTVTSAVTWAKKKLRLKSLKIPTFLTKPWVRTAALGIFLAAFAFTMVSGKKLPVLPVLLAASVVISFVYPEALWHRHLCPYGAILRLPAAKASNSMAVIASKCNNCGACARVCPAKAVVEGSESREILRNECLVCMVCADACSKDAIQYTKRP